MASKLCWTVPLKNKEQMMKVCKGTNFLGQCPTDVNLSETF